MITQDGLVESPRPNLQAAKAPNRQSVKISSDILLSLATVPLLAGLLASKAVGECLKSLGSDSEEVFRGDRLPLLNFPQKP